MAAREEKNQRDAGSRAKTVADTGAGLPGGFAKLVPSSREFLQIRTMVAELPGV